MKVIKLDVKAINKEESYITDTRSFIEREMDSSLVKKSQVKKNFLNLPTLLKKTFKQDIEIANSNEDGIVFTFMGKGMYVQSTDNSSKVSSMFTVKTDIKNFKGTTDGFVEYLKKIKKL
jgi:hypothetical protein